MTDQGMPEPQLRSPEIGKLAEALAKAQGEMSNPARNREVTVRSDKGSYTFKYATLDAILEAVRGPLSKNGLALTQTINAGSNGHTKITTTLMHSSGEWICSNSPVLAGEGRNSNQAMGSALTYAKRYAIAAIVGVAADEDDDANGADGNHIEESTERKPPARTATATRGAASKPTEVKTTPEGDALIAEIVGSQSGEDLKLWGKDPDVKAKIGKLPPAEQDRVRVAYADKDREFKEAA